MRYLEGLPSDTNHYSDLPEMIVCFEACACDRASPAAVQSATYSYRHVTEIGTPDWDLGPDGVRYYYRRAVETMP